MFPVDSSSLTTHPQNNALSPSLQVTEMSIATLAKDNLLTYSSQDLIDLSEKVSDLKSFKTSKETKNQFVRCLFLAIERLLPCKTLRTQYQVYANLYLEALRSHDVKRKEELKSRKVKLFLNDNHLVQKVASFLQLTNSKELKRKEFFIKVLEAVECSPEVLLLCLRQKEYEVLYFLFECGFTPNALFEGKTLLYHAVEIGDREAVEMLLSFGADMLVSKENKTSPVLLALNSNRIDLLECFFAQGLTKDVLFDEGQTLLHKAIFKNNHLLFDFLLSYKPNVNVQDDKGKTPLHYSAEKMMGTMTMRLIKLGADVMLKDFEGVCALDSIITSKMGYTLERIIESKQELISSFSWDEVLFKFVDTSSLSLLQQLLKRVPYDAEKHQEIWEKFAESVKRERTKEQQEKFKELLLWSSSEITSSFPVPGNAFVIAVKRGCLWLAKEFFLKGVSIDRGSLEGEYAVSFPYAMDDELFDLFVEKADLSTKDLSGNTLLHTLLLQSEENDDVDRVLQVAAKMASFRFLEKNREGQSCFSMIAKTIEYDVVLPICLEKFENMNVAELSEELFLEYISVAYRHLGIEFQEQVERIKKICLARYRKMLPPHPASQAVLDCLQNQSEFSGVLQFVDTRKGEVKIRYDLLAVMTVEHMKYHPFWVFDKREEVKDLELIPSWSSASKELEHVWYHLCHKAKKTTFSASLLLKEKEKLEKEFSRDPDALATFLYQFEQTLHSPIPSKKLKQVHLEDLLEFSDVIPEDVRYFAGKDLEGNKIYLSHAELLEGLNSLVKNLKKNKLNDLIHKVCSILYVLKNEKIDVKKRDSFILDVAAAGLACSKRWEEDIVAHYALFFPEQEKQHPTLDVWMKEKLALLRLEIVDQLALSLNEEPGNLPHTQALFRYRLASLGLFSKETISDDPYGKNVAKEDLERRFYQSYRLEKILTFLTEQINQDTFMHTQISLSLQKILQRLDRVEDIELCFEEEKFTQNATFLLLEELDVLRSTTPEEIDQKLKEKL